MNWNKFKYDDKSTWPTKSSFYWILDRDYKKNRIIHPIMKYYNKENGKWETYSTIDYWMEIDYPKLPE